MKQTTALDVLFPRPWRCECLPPVFAFLAPREHFIYPNLLGHRLLGGSFFVGSYRVHLDREIPGDSTMAHTPMAKIQTGAVGTLPFGVLKPDALPPECYWGLLSGSLCSPSREQR